VKTGGYPIKKCRGNSWITLTNGKHQPEN